MPFVETAPEWNAAGQEPPQSLKDAGWVAGYKPPDQYFNWYMYNTYRSILELQQKALESAALTNHTGNTTVHITDAERTSWNGKETPAGAQLKIDHASYKTVKGSKDPNGIFTMVEYRRKSDDTLAARSVLSGGASPAYTTRTVTFYAADGTTVSRTDTFSLSYDADGDLVSEV